LPPTSEVQPIPCVTDGPHMTDAGPGTRTELVEAMKRLRRATSARRNTVPATEAYEKALAAEERTGRQVMDLARRAGVKR
jgi:hypothetical protein